MTSPQDPSFEFVTALQKAKARAEDLARHGRAMQGLETGDGSAHESKDKRRHLIAKGKQSTLSALGTALQNAEYAAAYTDFTGLLGRAETASGLAITERERTLDYMRSRAVQMPDGRAVFRDQHGNAVTKDGEVLDPAFAAGIDWPDDAPSYEEYQKAQRELEAVRLYEIDVLGRYRDRMSDPDNPPTLEELQKWQREIVEQAPERLKPTLACEDNPQPGDTQSITAQPNL